jgi:hypothetical protein
VQGIIAAVRPDELRGKESDEVAGERRRFTRFRTSQKLPHTTAVVCQDIAATNSKNGNPWRCCN